MNGRIRVGLVAPMLFCYFVMGFMDLVGISTSYVQADFSARYPVEVFGFLPTALFVWFLVLGVPTASLMNCIGRKNTVLLSMAFTFVGMIVPVLWYSFASCIVAFALLGIGNTVLQVSINPLLSNVVDGRNMTGVMTVGQFCRSLCSLSGPLIASVAARGLGDWRYVFPIYALVTLISALWLWACRVPVETQVVSTSVKDTFALLGRRKILLLFFAMMAFLGVDIGTNTESAQLLMQRLGLDASLPQSVARVSHAPMPYFFCRLVGALAGVWILARLDSVKYFRICTAVMCAAVLGLVFASGETLILCLIGVIGLTCSSIFPIILYEAMAEVRGRENEVSGLMITAICGGAIASPAMSYAVRLCGGNHIGALCVLLLCAAYLCVVAFGLKIRK